MKCYEILDGERPIRYDCNTWSIYLCRLAGGRTMKQYRIQYWEDGGKYTMVISASDAHDLRESLKNRYNRFTMEEIV